MIATVKAKRFRPVDDDHADAFAILSLAPPIESAPATSEQPTPSRVDRDGQPRCAAYLITGGFLDGIAFSFRFAAMVRLGQA